MSKELKQPESYSEFLKLSPEEKKQVLKEKDNLRKEFEKQLLKKYNTKDIRTIYTHGRSSEFYRDNYIKHLETVLTSYKQKVWKAMENTKKEIKKHNNDKTFEWGWNNAMKHFADLLSRLEV